jgi:NADH-quinone oxidoreductase subunit L
MSTATLLCAIPLLPFAGFLINGTLGRKLPRLLVSAVALLFTALPAAIVARLWISLSGPESLLVVAHQPWITITGFQVDFAFAVDHLTLIMLAVVTGVGFLIHVYSVGYMAHEEGYWRFFAYLNLFMFFMSVLVLAENFLLLFVGWEGVGLASYLLIGFYFQKTSAADAGKKAFIVNRIGDFGFLLAMFLLIVHFGTLSFHEVFTAISLHPGWHGQHFLTAIALLLVVGAAGKSAQIPLYVWLPDAMEGPTPVSALIHAATMVTAGVYMIARAHVIFDASPTALAVVACIGAATAIFAASIGMVQHDIKRVLAYSTISQLGYMFLACGVGAYTAGIFHLLTHAFFKALLFLAAGSVIHALNGEQDMRNMGGLRTRTPITFWTMSAGVFAIAGIPPFAGFFSKDEILYRTFTAPGPLPKLLWLVGLITAGMTSFYVFRLWFKAFFGSPRFDETTIGHAVHTLATHAEGPGLASVHARRDTTLTAEDEPEPAQSAHDSAVHESPWIMLLPLVVLAILSVIGGFFGVPGHSAIETFLAPVFSNQAFAETTSSGSALLEFCLAAISVLVAVLGFYIAYLFYWKKPGTAAELVARNQPLYSILEEKYGVDEFYSYFVVIPLLMFTRGILELVFERGVVNGSGKASGTAVRGLAWLERKQISGNIRSYAGWLAIGAAAVIAIMIFGRAVWIHP